MQGGARSFIYRVLLCQLEERRGALRFDLKISLDVQYRVEYISVTYDRHRESLSFSLKVRLRPR